MVTWATNGLKRCKLFLRAGLTITVGLTKHRTHLFPINRRCGARSGMLSVAWQHSVSRPLGGTQAIVCFQRNCGSAGARSRRRR